MQAGSFPLFLQKELCWNRRNGGRNGEGGHTLQHRLPMMSRSLLRQHPAKRSVHINGLIGLKVAYSSHSVINWVTDSGNVRFWEYLFSEYHPEFGVDKCMRRQYFISSKWHCQRLAFGIDTKFASRARSVHHQWKLWQLGGHCESARHCSLVLSFWLN